METEKTEPVEQPKPPVLVQNTTFTVNRKALETELAIAASVVDKRSTIPVLTNVRLYTMPGLLALVGTDLEQAMVCLLPADVPIAGSVTVPGRGLLDVVRGMKAEDLIEVTAENNWATISAGRASVKLAGISPESYPELPTAPARQFVIPAQQLHQAIKRTIFAISAEESRFTLNGALFEARDEKLLVVATDGHRLSYTETDLPGVGEVKTIVPKAALNTLLKLTEKTDATVTFSQDNDHVFFQIGLRQLMARKLTGNFPDYNRVLPTAADRRLVVVKVDLFVESLRRALKAADVRSRAIRLTISGTAMTVLGESVERGRCEEVVPIDYSGPDCEIGFNAQYLLDGLGSLGSEYAELYLQPAKPKTETEDAKQAGAGEIRPFGRNDFKYVIMPMRI